MGRLVKIGTAACQFVDQMNRPPTSPDSIQSAAKPLQLAFTRSGRRGQPTRTLHHITDNGGSICTVSEFASFVKETGDTLIVFEPTSTYSRRLETLCRTEGILCCLLNPRVIPHLRQVGRGRSKTDKTDAELLYQYGIERGAAEAEELKHDELVQPVTAYLACYRVVQKGRIACQGLLEALKQDPATSKDLLSKLESEIVELKGKEAGHIAQAATIIAEDGAAARSLEALLSIPGVGPIMAITLLALFRKYYDTNRRQIVALAGLDPIQFRSGTSVHRKSRISKRGNREVRKQLYEATLSAARYNPAVKHLYRRLKNAGKPDKVARIAAARKLLLIAHAVYKSSEHFRVPEEVQT